MAGSPRVQPPSAFRGWRDETVLVVVVLSVAWCGLLAVGLAVDYVEYCTGYPIVECGPISASALGRLVLGWSLLGLIPSVLLIALVYDREQKRHQSWAYPRIA